MGALAAGITYLFNPLLLPVVGFILVAHLRGAEPVTTMWVAAIGLFFFNVVPLAILAVLIRMGRIESVEVRSRERRTLPFLLGMASFFAGSLLFMVLEPGVASLLTALGLFAVVSAALLTVITLWWKISVHASAAAALFGLILFFALNPGLRAATSVDLVVAAIVAGGIVPLVAWSRVYLRAHTVGQVVGGSFFGFIMSVGPLYSLRLAGFLPPIH